MRVFALVLAALVASAAAVPAAAPQVVEVSEDVAAMKDPEVRLISDLISSVIERVSVLLRDMGMDPLNVNSFGLDFGLPVPNLLDLDVQVNDFQLVGISDIVINNMNYGLLTGRLTFDISLPSLAIGARDSHVELNVLNTLFDFEYSGKVAIREAGIRGTVRISILSLAVTSMDLNFYLGALESQSEKFTLRGIDLSSNLDSFLGQSLFSAIDRSKEDISELVELIAWYVLNNIF